MEVMALGAFLNTLVPKVLEKKKESREARIAIDIDINYIDHELRQVKAALEDAKFMGGGTLSATVMELKQQATELSQKTQDCIHRFLNTEKKASCTEFVMKIKELRRQAQSVCSSLKDHCVSSQETPPKKHEDQYVDVPDPVGMAKFHNELLELVELPGRPGEARRKVISIVGFGGLGKTLLAKKVYEGTALEPRARVTAAAKHAKEVLREILRQVQPAGKHEDLNLESLGQHLATCLRRKRYLIVIDDIQRHEQWVDMKDVFPKDGDGTIIVTTTIHSVANFCSSPNGYVYKLPPLDKEESLDLLLNDSSWKRCLMKDIASDILNKCDGLPLAIVSMSWLLQGEEAPTSGACKDACTQLGACLVGKDGKLERMRRVLMNKYNSLTGDALRYCLLYFCMYKNNMDAVPRMSSLIRRWEAERLLVGSSRPTDVAAKYLKTLVDRNIIQPMEVNTNGTTRRGRPPGMMVEYISQISMSENFAALVSDAVSAAPTTGTIRRLSFHLGSAADDRSISGMVLKDVWTLAVSGTGCETILNFKKYELIAVLDLKECTELKDKHVKDICKLSFLKYLSLGDTIWKIPREIGRLEDLETLEMRTTDAVEVYREVLELPNLKHLLGKFKLVDNPDEDLEKFLSTKSGLVTITGFVTATTGGFPQLMCHMSRLTNVKMCCDARDTGKDFQDFQAFTRAIQNFTREGMNTVGDDRSLSIDFIRCQSLPLDFLRGSGSLTSLKLRGDLRPFLRSLEVSCFQEFTLLSGIKELCLSRTYLQGSAVLAGLTNLIALEYLKLDEKKLGPLEIESETFQKLTRLCLVGETSLEGITIQREALPRLVSLHLICKALTCEIIDEKVQLLNGCLGSLREIALDAGVEPAMKTAWKNAAKGHPNWPDVLLIQKDTPIRKA